MNDSDFAFEYIMQNRRAELDRKLERAAKYNLFPESRLHQSRKVEKSSLFLIAVRNFTLK